MLGWLIVERIKGGHATTLGRRIRRGGRPGRHHAVRRLRRRHARASIIGFLAGAICFGAIQLKFKFGYDDSLDVVGVHLVGGILGSLLLGLFADTAINALGADGVFFGGGVDLLGKQFMAVGATLVWSFVVTFILAKVIDATIGSAGQAR